MAVLADRVQVARRFARSANIERDVALEAPLEGYVVTARALDVVERIATAAMSGKAGGAWSITGPYGTGKSSLALLLDAVWGDDSAPRRVALELITAASPEVAEVISSQHRKRGTAQSGWYRGMVTAEREPLSHTILRALHSAVTRHRKQSPPSRGFKAADMLRDAIEDAASGDPRRAGPSPSALVEIARRLAEDAPLLLVIDEFGKNLEAIRDERDADPYLLQQLAEAGQGAGLPIFVLTLQHLSFEDYLLDVDAPQRREWAKVQGRFEDVAFVESAAQTRALIGTVFSVDDSELRGRIRRWALPHAEAMRRLGIADMADPAAVASCYPLHPLVSTVLPEMCHRYGQHERTLFSFLTGPGQASAASFLSTARLQSCGPLPSLGPDAVYDYFVASGALSARASGRSSRWTEIATRLRDAHGLSARQRRLAKTIAVLNLVSASGTLRASRSVLRLAEHDIDESLAQLEDTGLVTYRDFADEYRIWHGTDIDIAGLLEAARQRVQSQSLAKILACVEAPAPAVAARHSAEHCLLRVFTQRYAVSGARIEPLDAYSPYDGEVLLLVDANPAIPEPHALRPAAKPVVAAIPADVRSLESAAREVASVKDALDDPAVVEDWVARRELRERLAQARSALSHAVGATFGNGACRWVLLTGDGSHELASGRGSAALSAAADIAYADTPTVRNEMLNRTKLTSQGARARRILLEAMIDHGGEAGLGLSGYGPEVAMYRAFLERTGLHGRDARNGTMVFRRPGDPSLQPSWDVLAAEFRRSKTLRVNLADVYAALRSPPIGMKAGVIPVFVVAGLLAFRDEVAIYEHGTFNPMLTPEAAERLVRNPRHFDIKHFANTSGARRSVIDKLAARLGVRPRFRKHRVANVLAIVGHLVSQIRRLDRYTLRTRRLTPTTLSARDALLSAVEPDELLFAALPRVLGFPAIPAHADSYDQAGAYAEAVGSALDELCSRSQALLAELVRLLFDVSAESTRPALTGQAMSLRGEVLDPAVRPFVLTLAKDTADTDEDWIKAIATVVAHKAPAEWTDEDFLRFSRELPARVIAFQRLVALHAEQRADGGGPLEALRITVTRSDGSEHVQLVSVDQHRRGELESALDDALDRFADVTGSRARARHSLLALLGERSLSALSAAGPVVGASDNGAIAKAPRRLSSHV